jgi:hypothetical protein
MYHGFDFFFFLQALLYMIKVMDTVVDSPYVVVYFHTQSNSSNHPPMSYLKNAYSMLDYRYSEILVFCSCWEGKVEGGRGSGCTV